MGLVHALRNRRSAEPADATPGRGGQTQATDEPIPGYSRLRDGAVVRELSKHSQAELANIETYERAHENRDTVLAKLRYMRGSEPFAGYDSLSVEEILAALEDADGKTVKKVRAYERKFANRYDVLEAVERVRRVRRDEEPKVAPEPYQAASARQAL